MPASHSLYWQHNLIAGYIFPFIFILEFAACTCGGAFFRYNTGFVMAESTETVDFKEFQLHEKDTGSADVQVALLTKRIAQLTGPCCLPPAGPTTQEDQP